MPRERLRPSVEDPKNAKCLLEALLAGQASATEAELRGRVSATALQARRRELDAKLEEIRAWRAQGLPDEPARDDAGLEREWRQPSPLHRAIQPVVPQGGDDLDGIFED